MEHFQKVLILLIFPVILFGQSLDQKSGVVNTENPLPEKKFGIEFNPAYLLFASAQDALVISGGFSLFKVRKNAEIAFPILYFHSKRNNNSDFYGTEFSTDCHYRYFLSEKQGGFYLSGGIRYTYIDILFTEIFICL